MVIMFAQILQDITDRAPRKQGNDARLQMAVEFRLQSKRILQSAIAQVSERSAEISEGLVLQSSVA